LKIIWTNSALSSFSEIIDFLEITWGEKYIQEFYFLTEKTISQIQENPFQFKASKKHPDIRKGFIHKHVSLFNKVSESLHYIELLYFHDNRRKPD
jgi:plasmid stabilization system protein ParE